MRAPGRSTSTWVRTATTLALLAAAAMAAAPSRAQTSDVLRINGYSSFEFEKQLGDDGKGDPNGSFDADLLDLVINVTPTEQFRVAADITWEHGAATEEGRGNVAVEYAFAEYLVRDWLKVRTGKMFTHFGIYNEIHTAKPAFLTVKEPLATNKNDKFGSELRFYPRWQTGIAVAGNGHIGRTNLDYMVQVSNGEQETTNPFEEDDNTQKAFTARVRAELVPHLNVGLSLYTDSLTEFDEEGEDTGERTRLLSYGGYLEWLFREGLGLEVEYVAGRVSPSAASGLAENAREAVTAMVSYRLAERFTPYFRYEWLDPADAIADDNASLCVYGINVMLAQGFFLKAELDSVRSGPANIRFKGKDFTEFKAAVAVGF